SSTVVHTVTDAPRSGKQELRGREVRYLISMGIRTLCFVLAFVTSGALRWTFVVAAFALPYIAVVLANAGGSRDRGQMSGLRSPTPVRLTLSSHTDDAQSTHSKGNTGVV